MKRYFIFYVLFFFLSPLSSYAHNQEDDTKALIEIMETIRINGSEVIVGNEDMICYSKKYIFRLFLCSLFITTWIYCISYKLFSGVIYSKIYVYMCVYIHMYGRYIYTYFGIF